MTFFWIMWGFAALVGFGTVCFFLIGLADNSVNPNNAGMWLGILVVIAAVLLGSLALAKNDHLGMAKALLMVLVLPGMFFVLTALATIGIGGRWQ